MNLVLKKHIKKTFKYIMFWIVCTYSIGLFAAQNITQIQLNDEEFLLLDVKLERNYLLRSLEAYTYQDKVLVSVEFLFDALKLRYQIRDNELEVWKEDRQYKLPLVTQNNASFDDVDVKEIYWATDDYALYIDTQTLSALFASEFATNTFKLRLEIKTDSYLFPTQVIAIQNQKRALAEAASKNYPSVAEEATPVKGPSITIPDEYRLYTAPHGRVRAELTAKEKDTSYNGTLQLTSDLLYHTANLTLTQGNDTRLGSNLTLSRYKRSKDDRLLGFFDNYSIGDVSGGASNLISSLGGGLGFTLEKNSRSFRRNILTTTIEEVAPPGWDVELYNNGRLITNSKVPDDGQLVFEDVETTYGHNLFIIKLYGPFGEEETIEKNVNLVANPLGQGEMNYELFGFDGKNEVFSSSNDKIALTDFGGSFNVGLTDTWQLGGSIATQDLGGNSSSKQFYSIKNSFSLPGYLIESDISFNQDFEYAQSTSIIGNIFNTDTFSLSYQSSKDFNSQKIEGEEFKRELYEFSYAGNVFKTPYGLSARYEVNDDFTSHSLSTRFSHSYNTLHFSHGFSYSQVEFNDASKTANNDSLQGNLTVGGSITPELRLSGSVAYNLRELENVEDSIALNLVWNPTLFGLRNNFAARYTPMLESSNKWGLTHNLLWDHKEFLFNFSSSIDANENWSVKAGVSFFLGYDYHNNRLIFRNKGNPQSATLNIHTYLDRQINGVPDPLDYNLEGVRFLGNREWEDIRSGKNGRTLLAGTPAGGTFQFGAQWKSGSQTVLNDYVIYTHPGAYVDVNMPFYLTNEIIGFVEREGNGEPLAKVEVELIGTDVHLTTETDEDGYYEFINLVPDEYTVKVTSNHRQTKNYTSDVIGYKLNTPNYGGFVEVDIIKLQRKQGDEALDELIELFEYTEENSEAIIKEDNEELRRNYFSLPLKERVKAKHSLTQLFDEESENTIDTIASETESIDNVAQAEKAVDEEVNDNVLTELSTISNQTAVTIDESGVLPSLNFYKKAKETESQNLSPSASESVQEVSEEISSGGDIVVQPLPIENSDIYRLQLGAYRSKGEAEAFMQTVNMAEYTAEIIIKSLNSIPLYQVVLGNFSDREQARAYGEKAIANKFDYFVAKTAPGTGIKPTAIREEMPLVKKGWVIQFFSSKSPINVSTVKSSHRLFDELYTASNKDAARSGTKLNYLLSEVYKTKASALEALEKSNLSGWVRRFDKYKDIKKI